MSHEKVCLYCFLIVLEGVFLYFSIQGIIVLSDSTELNDTNLWFNVLAITILFCLSIVLTCCIPCNNQEKVQSKNSTIFIPTVVMIWSFITYYGHYYSDSDIDKYPDMFSYIEQVIYLYIISGIFGMVVLCGSCLIGCMAIYLDANNKPKLNLNSVVPKVGTTVHTSLPNVNINTTDSSPQQPGEENV